jgi:hypothetical protein
LGNGFTERFRSGGGQSIRSPVDAAREEKRERLGKKEEKRKKPTQNQYRQKGHQPQ